MPALKELRETRASLLNEADKLIEKADQDARSLSSQEAERFALLMGRGKPGEPNYSAGKIGELSEDIARRELLEQKSGEQAIHLARGVGGVSHKPAQWVDRDGKPVHVLQKADKWASLPGHENSESLSLGNLIRSMATGQRKYAPRELDLMQSMGGNVGSGGGFMVPSAVSASVIDKARGMSAVMAAGAVTVPMESDTLTMAKITSDASFVTRADNATITESDMVFGGVEFTARTIGTIVRMSRELAEDAPNAAAMVEAALARAFAAELDRQAVNGNGGAEMNGLRVRADITDVDASTGAIAWEDLHNCVVSVLTNNYAPTAYIIHPEIYGDLTILTSGAGTNAAKLWLTAPPLVAPLTPHVTTNCANSAIIVGDFTNCAFGIRQGVLVEVTRDGSDAFTKHSLLIKLTWRGSFNTLQGGAFARLTGITS